MKQCPLLTSKQQYCHYIQTTPTTHGKVIFMVRSKTQRNDADQQNKVSRQSNYFTKFEAFMIIFFAACVDKYEEADEAS